jgi:hypothetical protein
MNYFVDSIRRASAVDAPADSQRGPHCDGVVDAVGGEEGDCFAGLEAIGFDEGIAEVRGEFFDFGEGEAGSWVEGVDVGSGRW